MPGYGTVPGHRREPDGSSIGLSEACPTRPERDLGVESKSCLSLDSDSSPSPGLARDWPSKCQRITIPDRGPTNVRCCLKGGTRRPTSSHRRWRGRRLRRRLVAPSCRSSMSRRPSGLRRLDSRPARAPHPTPAGWDLAASIRPTITRRLRAAAKPLMKQQARHCRQHPAGSPSRGSGIHRPRGLPSSPASHESGGRRGDCPLPGAKRRTIRLRRPGIGQAFRQGLGPGAIRDPADGIGPCQPAPGLPVSLRTTRAQRSGSPRSASFAERDQELAVDLPPVQGRADPPGQLGVGDRPSHADGLAE